MLSVFWLFVGMLTGLLTSAVFIPPNQKDNQLPTPGDKSEFRTKTGCVTFKSEETECTPEATSLSFIASK